jgi:hypothetical protein
MSENRSSLSQADSYAGIGEYWDEHDLSDSWDQTKPAEFEVEIESQVHYFPVASDLSQRVRTLAKQRGISPETLLNLWVQEKLREQRPG